ncbi:MAG TPA: acyltransferase [Actinomycetota bacterium]|nr:acyltransferase [Actinomycetota bacterium]
MAESGLREKVVAASAGRDRVLDAVKAVALLIVIVGHSLAWHIRGGTAVNVLEEAHELVPLTWVFQVLPLFFAAGAVSNAASLARHGRDGYLRARGRRLLAPVIVYATVWTVLLLPFGGSPAVVGAGRFLAQLLWFAGVYLLVAAAAVFTSRWVARPWLTHILWLTAIVALDAVRTTDLAAWGWLNMLLVWGWLHQVGYSLPQLKGRRWTVPAGLGLIAGAVALAFAGPYAHSLISVAGMPGLSNLAPPSTVLAVFGAGQILLLAGLWPWLERVLRNDGRWVPIALIGARGMGMYLWHIPLVGLAAGTAMALGWSAPALSAQWWAVHILVVLIVVPCAWLLAGVAAAPERALLRLKPTRSMPAIACALGGATVLNTAATGFATRWGAGAVGLPSSALLNLLLLWLAFLLAGGGFKGRTPPPAPADNR